MLRPALLPSLCAALLLTTASGCPANQIVVRQATPNPFHAGTPLCALALRFDPLEVDERPEREWLESRSPTRRTAYLADRAALAEALGSRLAALGVPACPVAADGAPQISAGGHALLAYAQTLHTGIATWTNTELWAAVLVHDAEPHVLDEIRLRIVVPANATHSTFTSRMRAAGDLLAERAVAYVRLRQSGESGEPAKK